MDDHPTTREHLPWSILFALIGVLSGVVEGRWFQFPSGVSVLISIVLATMGWGLGFDVAKKRRMPMSKAQICIFAIISVSLFTLAAALCGVAGVFYNTAIVPRSP